MIQLVRALILVVCIVGATVSATPTKRCAYSNYRLPERIQPKTYHLMLDVNTGQHTYGGSVDIELKIQENNDELVNKNIIVLNVHPDVQVKGLTYFDVFIDPESGISKNRIKDEDTCRDDENELLVITLANDLADQSIGQLSVTFEAKIRDDDTGIYRSNYTTRGGLESYYVSTDFQPNRARRAFPCFDEPSFKATFTIELTHDPEKVALANMALLSEDERDDRKVSRFKTSPLMSMHMVAFAIGEFKYIEKATPSGSPTIRAYTPVGKSNQAQFALNTAVNAFIYLENYFNIQLPLDKIDMLTGVRHNYGVKGNWGLIVCNETLFLFDDENSSPINKGYIAQTVVRGLSQQWFGNLVTLKWWNDLWLQEGFNTWIGYNLTNHLYPKLQWEQNYLIESHQRALELDSQESTQQIRIADVGKENIDEIFNSLVHLKGTAIIKFLHDVYVEPNKFKEGISSYMNEHKYETVEAINLWDQLRIVSDYPVAEFIKSWTEQPGYPLVMLRAKTDRSKRLKIEQKRFKLASTTAEAEQKSQTWIIPVTIVFSDGQHEPETRKYIIDQPSQMLNMPDWFDIKLKNHWLKVNDEFRGFYHVHYSRDHLLLSLTNPILQKHLSTSNRIGLLNDHLALHVSKQQANGVEFSQFLNWYKQETEGVVLGQFAHALSSLADHTTRIIGIKSNLFMFAYARNRLTSEQFQNAGSPTGLGMMDSDGLLAVFSILLEWNHRPLIEEALALFDREGNKVVPIIREFVYKTVAKYGSDRQMNFLRIFSWDPNNCIEETNRLYTAYEIVSKRKRSLEPSSSAAQDSRGKHQRLA